MKNFQIGDHIRAIGNHYPFTSEGEVVETCGNKICVRTTSIQGKATTKYESERIIVAPEHFELVKPAVPEVSEEEIRTILGF